MMMSRICEREPEMLEAAARGQARGQARDDHQTRSTNDGDAVVTHLASCASCRDAVAAVAWMCEMADTSVDAPHPLPDPGVIWWKAQLLRRWESERRAVAPIERMHWVEIAAGVASLGVFLAWQWSGLIGVLARLSPANLAAITSSSSTATAPSMLVLVAGVTVALGATIFVSLHRRITGN
jgi:predicted anti-sigma-YlaC factor YlaD